MHDLGTWRPGHHSPPQLLLHQTCLTCTLLLLSLSLFPPHVASCCLSLLCVLLLLLRLILYLFFHLILTFLLHFSLPICFPSSSPPRPDITTRLLRGPWTCRSSGGSCKRRTQLTTPPRRRWYQTSASCSGTVLSSIMYVFPVFPLFYFQ